MRLSRIVIYVPPEEDDIDRLLMTIALVPALILAPVLILKLARRLA